MPSGFLFNLINFVTLLNQGQYHVNVNVNVNVMSNAKVFLNVKFILYTVCVALKWFYWGENSQTDLWTD